MLSYSALKIEVIRRHNEGEWSVEEAMAMLKVAAENPDVYQGGESDASEDPTEITLYIEELRNATH